MVFMRREVGGKGFWEHRLASGESTRYLRNVCATIPTVGCVVAVLFNVASKVAESGSTESVGESRGGRKMPIYIWSVNLRDGYMIPC